MRPALRINQKRKTPMKNKQIKITAIILAGVALVSAATVGFAKLRPDVAKQAKDYYVAKTKFYQGDYKTGERLLYGCGDFLNAKELRKKYSYIEAVNLKEEGEYQEAIKYFLQAYDYKDSQEQIRESYYLRAKEAMDDKWYYAAEMYFASAKGYADADELRLECMYQDVLDSPYRTSEISMTYLNELVEADYKDAKEIYENLNRLEVVIGDVNYSENSFQDLDVVKCDKEVLIHFRIQSGDPDKDYNITTRVQFPGGETDEDEITVKAGEYWVYSTDPIQEEGELIFTILDDSGNILDERTITVRRG